MHGRGRLPVFRYGTPRQTQTVEILCIRSDSWQDSRTYGTYPFRVPASAGPCWSRVPSPADRKRCVVASRGWASEEVLVDWIQHGENGADVTHSTQFNLGGNLYINDTQGSVSPDAIVETVTVPATSPATSPTTAPVMGARRSRGRWKSAGSSVTPRLVTLRPAARGLNPDSVHLDLSMEILNPQPVGSAGSWRRYWLLTAILAIPFVLWIIARFAPARPDFTPSLSRVSLRSGQPIRAARSVDRSLPSHCT